MRVITRIDEWPTEAIAPLLEESEREGFRFLRRAQDEWMTGTNRFSQQGEALFAVMESGRIVAVGGITRETSNRGRLRRFYVRHEQRRRGVGRALVAQIVEFARGYFSEVILRTDTEAGAGFYEALGFLPVEDDGCTHWRPLNEGILQRA